MSYLLDANTWIGFLNGRSENIRRRLESTRPEEIVLCSVRSGKPIGPNDLLIAAIALARGVTLVTHNTREFERVEELALEDWE